MKIFLTGSAGFIGFHLAKKLLDKNYQVLGIDNINSYYDTKLKLDRLNILKSYENFNFEKLDLENLSELKNVFNSFVLIYLRKHGLDSEKISFFYCVV